ncbi:MAG: TetR/AcrR family transcriptional regulator [Acidimicrobiales bacterium]|nr:TetR/AcrR family transcriptional regulator [Acidimicrobiales bacterium]
MNRRVEQAARTRLDILRAARATFARDGYRGATMTEIAAEAGVSVQTIYDSVGNKAALLEQIVDGMDAEIDIPELLAELPTLTEPRELIRWSLTLSGRFLERTGDIIRALATTGGDEAILAIREEGRKRHRSGTLQVATRIVDHAGLDLDDAEFNRRAALLSVTTDVMHMVELTEAYGWTVDEVRRALEDMLVPMMTAPPPGTS